MGKGKCEMHWAKFERSQGHWRTKNPHQKLSFFVREIFICEHIHKLEPGHLCANEYDQRSHDIAIWN